jgi:hypothetical protein
MNRRQPSSLRVLPHIVTFVVLLALSSTARAGPWNKAPGDGYAKLGSATFTSRVGCDDAGTCVSSAPFTLTAQTVFTYVELGISERLTFTMLLPYVFATNRGDSGVNFHTMGFADLTLGAQVGLIQGGPFVVASRLELKLPLYEGGPSIAGRQSRIVPGYPRSTRYFPALGDGQVDMTAFLSAGLSIPEIDAFIAIEPGFRHRSGVITDAFIVQATAGIFVLRRHILLMVNTQRVFTMPVVDDRTDVLGKAYWAIGPGAQVFIVDGLALEIGADALLLGQNAAQGSQLQWGLSYVF